MPILKVYDESTQSWVSIPSVQGETGAAAGFGTPTVSVDSTTGTPSATVTASGEDTAKVFSFAFSGLKGAKGDDGTTPSTAVTTITGGHNVAFNYGTGDPRNTNFDVMDGQDGSGIPAGGTTGQALVKSSNTDYAVEWADQSGGGMVVNITYSAGTYTADKTFAEVYEALTTNQQPVMMKYGTSIYVPYTCDTLDIYFTRMVVSTSGYIQPKGFRLTRSSATSTTTYVYTYTGNTLYIPTIWENPWSIQLIEDSDSPSGYRVETYNAPGPYDCGLSMPYGCIYFLKNCELVGAGDNYDVIDNVIPCIGATYGEHYDENYGYVPDGHFYFEKIKVINGSLTQCRADIYVISFWEDAWDSWNTTVTYTETPISSGGASIQQNNSTLSIS